MVPLLAVILTTACASTSDLSDPAQNIALDPAFQGVTGISYSRTMADYIIQTVAGGGVADGGPANEANLNGPQAVAVDREGNLYISDTGHHRIRRVDRRTGIITTIAGTGVPGNIGDHGPALEARLYSPHGIAFDSEGDLYIADTENRRVRRLDQDGLLHPFVGQRPIPPRNPLQSMSFRDHDHTLMFLPKDPQGEVELAPPHHLAVDPTGYIYVTEMENNRISKIKIPTGEQSVVAGEITAAGFAGDRGPAIQASLMNPHSIALDARGNLYVADTMNHRIRKVEAATGIITTVAGTGAIGFSGDGGPATKAGLSFPAGIAVGLDGTVYVADSGNKVVRKIDPDQTIETVAGRPGRSGLEGEGGPATKATLTLPVGLALDREGNLYIADSGSSLIRKVSPSGIINTIAGNGHCCFSGDGLQATNAAFTPPYGITIGPEGNLYVADRDNHRIRRVDVQTGVVTTVVGKGMPGFEGDGGSAQEALLSNPMGVAVGRDGVLFIADYGNHRIRKAEWVPSGPIAGEARIGEPSNRAPEAAAIPSAISRDGPPRYTVKKDDTLWNISASLLADALLWPEIWKTNPSISNPDLIYPGEVIEVPAGAGGARAPVSRGADEPTPPAPSLTARTSMITTVAGNGIPDFTGDGRPATETSLHSPVGIAIDSAGNLYISDAGNGRVRFLDQKTGILTTVAGTGRYGYSGDGGPATDADLASPTGLAVDREGNLYIADTDNHRVRRLNRDTGLITTVAGDGKSSFGGDGAPATQASLRYPSGISVDAESLYIADTGHHMVRIVSLKTGIIASLAGVGRPGLSGDGDRPGRASLNFPFGIALDPKAIYVADADNRLIRRLALGRPNLP